MLLANLESLEGTVSSETSLDLLRKSRRLVITNDHASNALSYKFNNSETYATLKGTESVSLEFSTRLIVINGSSVPYRIWVYS